jgi:hypothetical protein
MPVHGKFETHIGGRIAEGTINLGLPLALTFVARAKINVTGF